MSGSWHERARANALPPAVVGGSPIEPTCSVCHGRGRTWERDGRSYRMCRPCLEALLELAADLNELARRKARAA